MIVAVNGMTGTGRLASVPLGSLGSAGHGTGLLSACPNPPSKPINSPVPLTARHPSRSSHICMSSSSPRCSSQPPTYPAAVCKVTHRLYIYAPSSLLGPNAPLFGSFCRPSLFVFNKLQPLFCKMGGYPQPAQMLRRQFSIYSQVLHQSTSNDARVSFVFNKL